MALDDGQQRTGRREERRHQLLIDTLLVLQEHDKDDAVDLAGVVAGLQPVAHCAQRNEGRVLEGVAVDTRRHTAERLYIHTDTDTHRETENNE